LRLRGAFCGPSVELRVPMFVPILAVQRQPTSAPAHNFIDCRKSLSHMAFLTSAPSPNRSFERHPFRQMTVLPCSPSFGIHSKVSAVLRIAVLICSPVFSLIDALTVAWDREFGSRFDRRNTWLENSNL
jgi:hypothetical protein